MGKRKDLEKKLETALFKAVENGKVVDYLINGGLAILGFKTFGGLGGALMGPIALKLATAPGGTPPIAQISGISVLAFMGVTASGGLDYLAKQYEIAWDDLTKNLQKAGIPSVPVAQPYVRGPVGVR